MKDYCISILFYKMAVVFLMINVFVYCLISVKNLFSFLHVVKSNFSDKSLGKTGCLI